MAERSSSTGSPQVSSSASAADAADKPRARNAQTAAAGGTVSAIVHGLRWPEAAARVALTARLREAVPGIEIVEAREEPAACVGAAAVMARAVPQTHGQILLFLEPSVLPTVDDLRRLVEHAARGLAVEAGPGQTAGARDADGVAPPPIEEVAPIEAVDSVGAVGAIEPIESIEPIETVAPIEAAEAIAANEAIESSPVIEATEATAALEAFPPTESSPRDLLSRLAASVAQRAISSRPAAPSSRRDGAAPVEGAQSARWAPQPGPHRAESARAWPPRAEASHDSAARGTPHDGLTGAASSPPTPSVGGSNAPRETPLAPSFPRDTAAYPVDTAARPPTSPGRTPIVAIARATYDALGGFDRRLWSIGVAEDLMARAAIAGVPVERVALTGMDAAAIGPAIAASPAYPLRPAIARLLVVRNALLTAFKTAPADALGEAFAARATHALLDACQAAGIDSETFRFGGSWGRGDSPWRAVARRITGRSGLASPLRDPDGCLLPLLAIDSVLDELPSSIDERDAWRHMARGHDLDHIHAAAEAAAIAPLGASADAPVPAGASPERADRRAATALDDEQSRTTSPAASRTAAEAPTADAPVPGGASAERADRRAATAIGDEGRVPSLVGSRASATQDVGAPAATVAPVATVVPVVSVIVVNWNGRTHLRDCFGSLQRSDYPADRLQLICVDNGSTDGSVDLVRAEFPGVTIVALDRNAGFTGGNEAGLQAATGEVFVFLNNDMRVEPDCLRELVGALDAEYACAGARVLSWDGRAIDFVRGSLNFEGRGFQDFYGLPNVPELATPTETFFPNGGACAVTREAYVRAGGFDPSFFAYYDDVDLGWRLRLTGTRIRVAGRAVVYHRHGATSRTQPGGQKRFLMDRNAFWTLMKNYGEAALHRTLGPALLLAIRRVLDESQIDVRASLPRSLAPFVVRCRERRAPEHAWTAAVVYEDERAGGTVSIEETVRAPIIGLPLEALGALCAAVEALPRIAAARAAVQGRRTVADRDILPRFGRTLEAVWPLGSYRQIQQTLMEAEALADVFRARTRLLIIGHEALARHISGPAVRVLELGRALSTVARVTIATPAAAEIDDPRCTFAAYDPADASGLKRLAEDADVLLVQGFTLARYPFLKTLHVPIVVDLYCPFTLEHLEQTRARLANPIAGGPIAAGPIGGGPVGDTAAYGERLATAQHDASGVLGVQNQQLLDGDFFLCASETQRDFWIGTLHTQGRVNPLTYGDDPTLRRLIDVVPFGLPEMDIAAAATRAQASRGEGAAQTVMRGVWPGIGAHDRILLWAGSLLDWQDPLTLIQAVGELARTRRDVKLVFMGTRHPNPLVSPMQVVGESRALAAQLGLLDTHVFFNDWVPYDQRALFLREADLGLSTHRDHLETHFSFRTRMLDYIWAGLPIVCTRGDFFAGLVETRGLGAAVPPGDVASLTAAIARLLDDGDDRRAAQAGLDAIRQELRWSRVVAPLARYCAAPYLAADHAPVLREFRQRLAQQYRESKWFKQTALRLGLSEFQLERLKQSSLGRAAMSLQARRALRRARRRS